MDEPISWLILTVIAYAGGAGLVLRFLHEKEKHEMENEEFFIGKES
jgi:hypothetical protein